MHWFTHHLPGRTRPARRISLARQAHRHDARACRPRPVEPLEPRALLSATLVTDLIPGPTGSSPRHLTPFDDRMVFAAGPGLWVTDGTGPGTSLIFSGNASFTLGEKFPALTTPTGPALFFGGPDGLWKTDATAAGTTRVAAMHNYNVSHPLWLAPSGGAMYFVADSPYFGKELWRTDGTADGTILVKDLRPGSAGAAPENLTDVNGTLYFTANPGNANILYKTDGTPAGTVQVAELRATGPSDGFSHFTPYNGNLYFAFDDGVNGMELWKSDGTAAGTTRLTDVWPGAPDSLYALGSMMVVGNALLFTARGPGGAPALWRTDGTVAGTTQVVALPEPAFDIVPGRLVRAGPSLAYFKSAGKLWRTDGTPAGTGVVQQLPPNTLSLDYAAGRFFFVVEDSAGEELWTSQGTAATTARVRDINPGPASSFPVYMTESNGRLLFRANDAVAGSELWSVDLPIIAPAAPAALAAVAVSGSEVRLTWTDAADNEAAYTLERSATEDFATVIASVKLPAGASSHVDRGLAANTTYFYRLRAFNRAGTSADLRASATTPAAPSAPTGFTVTSATHERVALAWADTSPDEAGFRIERSPVPNFSVIDATYDLPAGQQSFTDTAVAPENHYYYRVSAAGPAGRSAAPQVRATTPGLPPTALKAWGISPNMIELQWVPPAGAGRVRFERAAPGEPFTVIGSENLTTTRLFDGSRKPNTTYRYRARSEGPFGLGVPTEEFSATTPPASPAFLAVDLNPAENPTGSVPSPLVVLGGVGYFTAFDDVAGRELWRTDGTTAGTRRVIDLNPGTRSGVDPNGPNANYMAVFNGALYFNGNDGSHGAELWRTDGTEAGTVLVAEPIPGHVNIGVSPSWLTDAGGTLFFVGGLVNDRELWKTDGTAAGTVLVKDIWPGPNSSVPRDLVALDGIVYFTATDGTSAVELWRSDGTADGTYRLSDVRPSSTALRPESLTVVGDTLFFTAHNSALGRELWKTDGTVAGTVLVANIAPGVSNAEPSNLFASGDTLLFSAIDTVSGQELWRTDGTTAGTTRVADLAPGSASSSPFGFTHFGDKTYFLATRPSFLQLYETDGSAAGTRLVREFAGIPENAPRLLGAPDGLYLVAGEGGVRLWKSDGTADGTVPLSPPLRSFPRGGTLTAVGGTVLFPALEPPFVGEPELWRSDGTVAGTYVLKNIRKSGRGSNPDNLTAAGGGFYFTTDATSDTGAGLWKSDGTFAGTTLLRPGVASRLTAFGNSLYFLATDPATGTELWKTDGTAGGTTLLKDITPGAAGTTFRHLTPGASRLFFTVRTDTAYALWTSDGTPEGTTLLSPDAMPLTPDEWYRPDVPLAIGDTLYFRGGTDQNGTGWELWKSDGTAAGTGLVKDLIPGSDNGSPYGFTNVNGTLFFIAAAPGGWNTLWKSDGTTAGTVPVKEMLGWPIQNVTAVGGTLYFTIDLNATAAEIWKSDGTSAGTVRLGNPWPGARESHPSNFTAVGDTLYFTATDPVLGPGLWKTDGTVSGTTRIRPVYGPLAGMPFRMFAANGTLFYTDAGTLWRSDGTGAGTIQVLQLAPGTPVPDVSAALVGNTLYARGYDPEHGTEIWGVPAPTGNPVRPTSVVGRHISYDGVAVAPGKQALRPGQTATAANVTNVSRGITRVVVDLANLPAVAAPSGADFVLHVGNGSTWTELAVPVQAVLSRGVGPAGTDRITLSLPDNAARNTWLRVTVKTNANTGLAAPDVFYFGSLPGDATGATPAVNTLDLARVRANVGNTSAAAKERYDFNRDGVINAADVLIARANLGRSLPLFTAPPAVAVQSTTIGGAAPARGTAPRRAAYSAFADINGDGRINAADQGAVKARLNNALPVTSPASVMDSVMLPAPFDDEGILDTNDLKTLPA